MEEYLKGDEEYVDFEDEYSEDGCKKYYEDGGSDSF